MEAITQIICIILILWINSRQCQKLKKIYRKLERFEHYARLDRNRYNSAANSGNAVLRGANSWIVWDNKRSTYNTNRPSRYKGTQ